MKEKILIYTIFRNSSFNIENYYDQLRSLVLKLNDRYEFYVSLYENDSIDDTKEKLERLDFSFCTGFSLITEHLGSVRFKKSIKDETRVKNLSAARNKALLAKDFLKTASRVLCIESDICYDVECIEKLLTFKENNNLPRVDIVSAVSFRTSGIIYDTWATRRDSEEEHGDLFVDRENKKYDRYWSTFNCICLYDADVLRKGAMYHWYNDRLKKFDCDTVVICEKFRELGHDDIFINYESTCDHIKRKKGI
jgi:hypothetical protein